MINWLKTSIRLVFSPQILDLCASFLAVVKITPTDLKPICNETLLPLQQKPLKKMVKPKTHD